MIELTMRELVDSIESLQYILNQPVRARTAFRIANLIEAVEKENTRYNNVRNNLIKKYAIKDANNELVNNNGNFNIAPENIDTFNEELTELLNTNITLNVDLLSDSDFEQMELSPLQMIRLKKYIKKEEA